MSRTEELIDRSKAGDESAKAMLVTENSGLIWSIVRRFTGRGVETDDLYQLGCLGFLKAVDGFDTRFGTQFSTYAVPKIAGEIRRFLRDDGAVKVSRGIKEQAAQIAVVRNRLTGILGREPTLQELYNQTLISPDEIVMIENTMCSVESIHQTTGEDGFTLESILSDSESEDGFIEKISLRQAVRQLPERERQVISLRYYHGLTQANVARILSVSQVQISRIEKKALTRLRELMC